MEVSCESTLRGKGLAQVFLHYPHAFQWSMHMNTGGRQYPRYENLSKILFLKWCKQLLSSILRIKCTVAVPHLPPVFPKEANKNRHCCPLIAIRFFY